MFWNISLSEKRNNTYSIYFSKQTYSFNEHLQTSALIHIQSTWLAFKDFTLYKKIVLKYKNK